MKSRYFNDPTVYGEDSAHVKKSGWRARIFKKQRMYGFAVEKWDERRNEWEWRCGTSGIKNVGSLLLALAQETDGTDIPLCCALPLARTVAAKIKRRERDN